MADRLAELLRTGVLQRLFTRAEIEAQRTAKADASAGRDRNLCEQRLAAMEGREPTYDRDRG